MTIDLARFGNISFEGPMSEQQVVSLQYMEAPYDGEPPIRTVHDVYVYPYTAGVFDAQGQRVYATNPFYMAAGATVSPGDTAKYLREDERISSRSVDLAAWTAEHGAPKKMPKPTIYLGNYITHYGHWVVDGMARLWAELARGEDVGRTLVPTYGAASQRDRPYVADVLDVLNLNGFTSARPRRLRHYETMFIPEPAFQIRHRIYRNAAAAHEHVTRALNPTVTATRRPVYLSRSRLVDGMRSIVDEQRIETLFAQRGFDIVHPQEMSFRTQVELFNSAPIIAGLAGSAFHTAMFSLPDYQGTLLILTGNEVPNGRLILQGSIKNYRTIFAPAYRFEKGVVTPDVELTRTLLASLAL